MSEPREYPIGALGVLAGDGLLSGRDAACDFGRGRLDALAAMSPEDRAALARWVWPEAGNEFAMVELVRAATVERIVARLRDMNLGIADGIEREFGGGPDAVK